MNYILYNPISGHGNCKELAEGIKNSSSMESTLVDMTTLDYSEFFKEISPNPLTNMSASVIL